MGVATVGLLYMTVKRRFGAAAGLLAGAVLALTPVATLMFRFNNPDALLVLLLVASAYTLTRAMEKAETKWIVLAGVLIGFGFLTKMLQAFLVVPGFALVYLIAAPTNWWRRVRQVLYGGVAIVVVGRLVGRDRHAVAEELAALHRRLAEQLDPRPDLRLQRLRPHHRQRDRQRRRRRRPAGPACGASPASPACSTPTSAARSPG